MSFQFKFQSVVDCANFNRSQTHASATTVTLTK